jgi:hypothetical protein
MDERIQLPPLAAIDPSESAFVTLARELYAELGGMVLASALRTASGVNPPYTGYPIHRLSQEVREQLEHSRRRLADTREQNMKRAAPLDGAVVEAIFATALQDWPEKTARRMSAIGLKPLHAMKLESR